MIVGRPSSSLDVTHFIQNVPLFKGISNNSLEFIAANHSIVSYAYGSPIINFGIIPSDVLFIINGSARLFLPQPKTITPICRLNKFDTVGLTSHLVGKGIEEISSITDLLGLSIPDRVIISLYTSDHSFRSNIDNSFFDAEIVSTAANIFNSLPANNCSLTDFIKYNLSLSKSHNISTLQNAAFYLSSTNHPCYQQGTQKSSISPNFESTSPSSPFDYRFVPLLQCPSNFPDESSTNLSEVSITPITTSSSPLALSPQPYANTLGQNPPTLIHGKSPQDSIRACIKMLSQVLEFNVTDDSIDSILERFFPADTPITPELITRILSQCGFYVSTGAIAKNQFSKLPVPTVVFFKSYPALLVESNISKITLLSPVYGSITLSPKLATSCDHLSTSIVVISNDHKPQSESFGFKWFIPYIIRYKLSFFTILLTSFVVQLFTLATPLLFQVIIDRVFVQRSLSTLNTVGLIILLSALLEALLSYLKTALLFDTTNRIDTKLGSIVIDHLFALPLSYFDKRPVGELANRLSELERIRSFLTGQGLTTILDSVYSILYLVVMLSYSPMLTLVSLSVFPIQLIITFIGAPVFRRQFRLSAESSAKTQSLLVESISGIHTLKAQNIELSTREKWLKLYSEYVTLTFNKVLTATFVNQLSSLLQKISQILVLWFGASLVLSGKFSIGQLIAFRMISNFVTQPLLRISTIWQSVQELKISIERLSDIMGRPTEVNRPGSLDYILLPPIIGHIKFENVSFKFVRTSPYILKDISLDISPKSFVAFVGPSGSGKSTLSKLISRLYQSSTGVVSIDGYDVTKLDLTSLRSQIGIVPQDPILFSGSVSANISLSSTSTNTSDIVAAAKIACAHDFIMSLPDGYATQVGERGCNLSGGQRQRIAIARMILSKPRLIILDEATSALDPVVEIMVLTNLRQYFESNTLLYITHRVESIRDADNIIVMDSGTIAEIGKHEELFANKSLYYSLLFKS